MKTVITRLDYLWKDARAVDASVWLVRHGDLLVMIAMIAAVAAIIIPMPAFLISLFVVFNLAAALVLLIVSLYIANPIQLSSYPTILLITTLFRLCLSISVSRAILTTGNAGDVITALGSVTASGNLLVGAVLFLIILAVQFVVVAKGTERVAEVAARFTLDAMPGRQMSIDADMRTGLIPQNEARALRSALQRESQLYGAMDGAMKFVKNDAVATILIAMINVIAGLTTGVVSNGLTFAQASRKYTILTIGDGLAAIIPSVLISISAGMVITRVASEQDGANVGSDIAQQILTKPKPMMITAGLLLALLLIPGMPSIPLLVLAGGLGIVGYSLHRRQKLTDAQATERLKSDLQTEDLQPTFAVPLSVVVSKELTSEVISHSESGSRFRAELAQLRSAIYYDLGVMLPGIHVSMDAPLKPYEYFIAVKEVPVARAVFKADRVMVNGSAAGLSVFGLSAEDTRNPANLNPAAWIPADQRVAAERAGLKVWDPADVILLHLSQIMRRYAHEFVGIQEAQALLDFTARGLPKLVESVVPGLMTIQQFTQVLQRLVQEGISIRDIKSILDTLAESVRIEEDPVMLTEHVRSSMKRYISFRYSKGQDVLFIYLIDPEIEDVIRGAIRRTSTGSYLSLDPAISNDILEAFRRIPTGVMHVGQKPVIVTDFELRRFVRKMVELEFPDLPVLSYQELSPELRIQPLGKISMRSRELPRDGEAPPTFLANRAMFAQGA